MKRKADTEIALYGGDNKIKKIDEFGSGKTSELMAPIVTLEGHQGDIFTLKFHPEGRYLASAGFDRRILIWKITGEAENISTLTGHSGTILDLHFSTDGSQIITASTDKTVSIWDFMSARRLKKLKGHSGFVNCAGVSRRGRTLVASGSDDCTARVWDPRCKGSVQTMVCPYQVTAVSFNDTAEQLFTSGIDNDIKVWDMRTCGVVNRLRGHSDTVTGLSLSYDGSYLLSNSMDNSLRIWDVRPYAPPERCVKILSGHSHNFEKNLLKCSWSSDGCRVAGGSADRMVYIWDTTSRRILYKLPGHTGSVNDVQFHPNSTTHHIVASGSSDKVIYLGELDM